MLCFPITGTTGQSDVATIGAASVQFANINAMAPGQFFVLVASGDLWFLQSANPTASAAAGSCFLPAKTPAIISGANGARIAIIQDGASTGKASLTRVQI